MRAHIISNLFNKLGEKDKKPGFAKHLIDFPPSLINSII